MFQREDFGPVQGLRQGRRLFGLPPYMTVCCYAVDGLLIDSGLPCFAESVLEWSRKQGVVQGVITHHHEDHSGGAARLQQAHIPVRGSRETARLLSQGFSVRFYQWAVWGGRAPRTQLADLGATVETERYRFEVLPAPGHCPDQVVLFERAQGWLFSGDAFLARKVKLFRADEDFAATRDSLRRLGELPVADLYCAHRPVLTHGQKALQDKLEHLTELEGRVRELHAQGLPVSQIVRRALGRESLLLTLATAGDLSKANLVRSILFGPRRRADTL